MTNEYHNIDLVYRWFDQVWNQGREEAIDEMYAANGLAWGLGDAHVKGPDAFKLFHSLFHKTLSGIHCTVDDVIASGDRAAFLCTFTMTHKTTGKQITLRGGGFVRISKGKIIEAWNAWDFLGVLIQLGVLSEDALADALKGGG